MSARNVQAMTNGHPLGSVERLYRYPVKALAAHPMSRATVDGEGFAGDRGSALFVSTPGRPRSGKTLRGKELAPLHTLAEANAAAELARARGIDTELRTDGPYFDDSPISIVFDTWLRALEDLVYEPLDPLRFRPNIFARAASDFAGSEATLVGLSLTIGDVRLRCTSTIKRCVTITYDIETARADPAIARACVDGRDNVMGVYCTVERGGEIATGDAIERG